MVFSSTVFLFKFLPIVLFFYFLAKNTYQNFILLIASLIFYAWGEPKHIVIMLILIIFNYFMGLTLSEQNRLRKLNLIVAIIGNLSFLFFFKYANFFITNINQIFNLSYQTFKVTLPIGISFFTFQSMSYVIDVYRGEALPQKSIYKLALYVSLFPQLVAGPIVRYQTVEEEISNRIHTLDNISQGITRFIYGLAKKVLLANFLGNLADTTLNLNSNTSVLAVWIGVIAYSLQIFFDFSGYSDMAIGLGKVFGFNFLENFNYPYISTSVSEFWRRWHMSLGSWFRDYIYIPLGGNRCNKFKVYRNLFAVWFLTGFWHGANWTFILWGLLFFVAICIEKSSLGKFISNMWKPLQHLYLLFVILIGWILFRSASLTEAFTIMKSMFGFNNLPISNHQVYQFINDNWYTLIFAIILSTPIVPFMKRKFIEGKKIESSLIFNITKSAFLTALFILVLLVLINSTYNPFLYFNF